MRTEWDVKCTECGRIIKHKRNVPQKCKCGSTSAIYKGRRVGIYWKVKPFITPAKRER